MEIVLDCRELKLCAIMEDIKTEQLDIGDVLIRSLTLSTSTTSTSTTSTTSINNETAPDKVIDPLKPKIKLKTKPIIINADKANIYAIIERKTYSDLYSSIIDGRYAEQKARMKSVVNENSTQPILIYIIEGQLKTNTKICKSACISMALDNIAIIYSDSVLETKDIILKIFEKISKNCNGVKQSQTYESLIRPCKKDNMTAEICYIQQLSCIPGLSMQMANEIATKWPNMRELIKEIELNTNKNLKDLKINNRRISKAVVQKLIEYI